MSFAGLFAKVGQSLAKVSNLTKVSNFARTGSSNVVKSVDDVAIIGKNTAPGTVMGFPSQYVDDLARTGRLADAAGSAATKSSLAGSLAKNVAMSGISFGVFAVLGKLFGSRSSKVGAAQDSWTRTSGRGRRRTRPPRDSRRGSGPRKSQRARRGIPPSYP
eukprot:jgi/Mesvir1/13139/Mv06108-RA.1